MELDEAWAVLGRDLGRVTATLASVPLENRGEAMEKAVARARRIAGRLSAPHHPDAGGNVMEFRRIWEALAVIEKQGENFRVKLEEQFPRTLKGPVRP